VRELHRPPRLTNREGEPTVLCRTALRMTDPEKARSFLDERFERSGDGWIEQFEIEEGDVVLRASIRLDGNRLVIETNSEERLERLLDAFTVSLGEYEIEVDERQEPSLARGARTAAAELNIADPAMRAALEEFVAEREEQWCDEAVPALGGVTPRQAATDPTRRESCGLRSRARRNPDARSDPFAAPGGTPRRRR